MADSAPELEQLRTMIVNAYAEGYARAVADFRLSCSSRPGRRRRRSLWAAAVLKVLGIAWRN